MVGKGLIVTFDWQIIVVGFCVAWAIIFLARQCYRLGREPANNHCGGKSCSGCASNSIKTTAPLVQLEASPRRDQHPSATGF